MGLSDEELQEEEDEEEDDRPRRRRPPRMTPGGPRAISLLPVLRRGIARVRARLAVRRRRGGD